MSNELTLAELRALPGAHYSDGRRYSRISKAWIFAENWNDSEEAAYQSEERAKAVAELELLRASHERLREAAEHAREVLSTIYAKYGTKIGPYSSQAQQANVELGAALAKAGEV